MCFIDFRRCLFDIFNDDTRAIALGPSMLESLACGEFSLGDALKIVVPDNLIKLLKKIEEGSSEHRLLLTQIFRHFRRRNHQKDGVDSKKDEKINKLKDAIYGLKEKGRLIVVEKEESEEEIERSLEGIYPGGAFEASLSLRRNFLRDYLSIIYSWSKRTGGIVLERTKRVFSDMGGYIATLHLPEKVDYMVDLKGKVLNVYDFKGGKGVRFFIACAVGVAGMVSPPFGAIGVVITFMDP